MQTTITVNGEARALDVDPRTTLLDALRELMVDYAVVIHTTRAARQVADWLDSHGFDVEYTAAGDRGHLFWNRRGVLLVTSQKVAAVAYIDDRAIRFTDWPQALAALGGGDLPPGATPTPLRAYEGEAWPVHGDRFRASDGSGWLHDTTATLRRVGWLDQRGRVWLHTPPQDGFDGGSLTPLLIDARD